MLVLRWLVIFKVNCKESQKIGNGILNEHNRLIKVTVLRWFKN